MMTINQDNQAFYGNKKKVNIIHGQKWKFNFNFYNFIFRIEGTKKLQVLFIRSCSLTDNDVNLMC